MAYCSLNRCNVMHKLDALKKPHFSLAARGRYIYHIEGQFHFGFILFL